MALLDVKNLSISFGGLRAVDGFEMQIEKGELYGLIGPNGAGILPVRRRLTSTKQVLQEHFRISVCLSSYQYLIM